MSIFACYALFCVRRKGACHAGNETKPSAGQFELNSLRKSTHSIDFSIMGWGYLPQSDCFQQSFIQAKQTEYFLVQACHHGVPGLFLYLCSDGVPGRKGYTLYQKKDQEYDELRARFTKWMEVTLYRARRRYLRKCEGTVSTISLEETPESALAVTKDNTSEERFEFQQEALADAFSKLSPERQIVLTLLFAEGWKPSQVALYLQCSPQHVYDQRYQALKLLKKMIRKEGIMKGHQMNFAVCCREPLPGIWMPWMNCLSCMSL